MRGEEYGVRHLIVEMPQSLLEFLNGLVSSERAHLLCELGSVYVNDSRSTDSAKSLSVGDRVRVHLEPRRYDLPKFLKSRIKKENDGYLLVDKPSGLPVHALVDNLRENLIAGLETELGLKLFITHRLDIETSGLLILAKTPEAQAAINAKFHERLWKRTYIALTEKPLTVGRHVHFMEKSPKAPKHVYDFERAGSLRCELEVLNSLRRDEAHSISSDTSSANRDQSSIVPTSRVSSVRGREWHIRGTAPYPYYENEIQLLTGRTHQIRAQLSALGAPILGDQAYGSTLQLRDSDTNALAIALWAFQIQTLDV